MDGIIRMNVDGMTCERCSATVSSALENVAGVHSVDVQLIPKGTSTVTVVVDNTVSLATLRPAIAKAGFAATPIG